MLVRWRERCNSESIQPTGQNLQNLVPRAWPLPDAPEYGLTIDSIPTFADAEEDEKVLKLKTTFQRTWAVEALLCGRRRSELDDFNKVLQASGPTLTAVELKQIIHKFRTDTSLMLP